MGILQPSGSFIYLVNQEVLFEKDCTMATGCMFLNIPISICMEALAQDRSCFKNLRSKKHIEELSQKVLEVILVRNHSSADHSLSCMLFLGCFHS